MYSFTVTCMFNYIPLHWHKSVLLHCMESLLLLHTYWQHSETLTVVIANIVIKPCNYSPALKKNPETCATTESSIDWKWDDDICLMCVLFGSLALHKTKLYTRVVLNLRTVLSCCRWSWPCGIPLVKKTTTGCVHSPIQTLTSFSCVSPLTVLTVLVSDRSCRFTQ